MIYVIVTCLALIFTGGLISARREGTYSFHLYNYFKTHYRYDAAHRGTSSPMPGCACIFCEEKRYRKGDCIELQTDNRIEDFYRNIGIYPIGTRFEIQGTHLNFAYYAIVAIGEIRLKTGYRLPADAPARHLLVAARYMHAANFRKVLKK